MLWRLRAHALKMMLPLAVLLLLLYVAEQLMRGERGIVTWRLMKEQVAMLEQQNEQLKADLVRLDGQVVRLKPDSDGHLDEDYVDELIRRNLPLLKDGEEVLLN